MKDDRAVVQVHIQKNNIHTTETTVSYFNVSTLKVATVPLFRITVYFARCYRFHHISIPNVRTRAIE